MYNIEIILEIFNYSFKYANNKYQQKPSFNFTNSTNADWFRKIQHFYTSFVHKEILSFSDFQIFKILLKSMIIMTNQIQF